MILSMKIRLSSLQKRDKGDGSDPEARARQAACGQDCESKPDPAKDGGARDQDDSGAWRQGWGTHRETDTRFHVIQDRQRKVADH